MSIAAVVGPIVSLLSLGDPVKLKVIAQGFPESVATFQHKLLPDGSKQTQLAIELRALDGRKLRVRFDRTYRADGSPIRAFAETFSEKPRYRKTATATFNAVGAHVVVDENGKRTVHEAPLAQTAPRECMPEFWFLRDKPKVGDRAKYYHFDLDKLEWKLVEARYAGVGTVKIGGIVVRGHRVVTATGESLLDESGAPLRIVDASVTMERTSISNE